MPALAREQTSNCTNPVLDVFTSVSGVLTDVSSLQYQIFDVSDPAKQVTPVQVYPATPGDRATVNVGVLCPDPGAGKLSTGRYVATWTPSAIEPLGTHRLRWFFKLLPTSPEQTFAEEFEVLPGAAATGDDGYCTVSDLRDEGVPASFDDTYLYRRIQLASRMIDRATGRFFSPRPLTLKLDGRGGRMLLLDVPIIGVSTVEFETSPFQPSSLAIEPDLLRIYNRHLSQGLTQPDDRNNPKIELYHASDDITNASPYVFTRLIFPLGQQNITVNGVFGYTDYDGANPQGITPPLIRRCAQLMVVRDLYRLMDGRRTDALFRNRLTSERTRDQAYTLEGLGSLRGALLTGDAEIDTILASYMRPPSLGSA
jgi:hypothetical protein